MMSNRTSIIIGAVFKTTATVLAALSTDVGVLFLSIGVLDGNVHTPTPTRDFCKKVLMQWKSKRVQLTIAFRNKLTTY